MYEISLAQCRVNPGATLLAAADIIDERADPALCGNIREPRTYAAYVSRVELPPAAWARQADGQYHATANAPGILLGGYVYTVSPTPETMRLSGGAGGILMLTPTAPGRATFTATEQPVGTVVMVIKREVAKDE